MSPTTARDILDENATAFEASTPVDDAIDAIRTSASDASHTVYYAYVVDEDETLEGIVSLRELLNADPGTLISGAASDTVVSVAATDPLDRVATMFTQYSFVAFPVVDESAVLCGVVRASDVIEALDEEGSKKVLNKMIHDVEYDPGDESAYECFDCGTIVSAVNNPGACPNCGGDVRHRQTTIE